jgi:hypothetical protein
MRRDHFSILLRASARNRPLGVSGLEHWSLFTTCSPQIRQGTNAICDSLQLCLLRISLPKIARCSVDRMFFPYDCRPSIPSCAAPVLWGQRGPVTDRCTRFCSRNHRLFCYQAVDRSAAVCLVANSHCQHNTKLRFAAHHAGVRFRRFFQWVGFDHRAHAAEFGKSQRIFRIRRRSCSPPVN